FWPLHELAAPLQALWPLQALAPLHFTPSAKAVVAKVAAANAEAAAMTRVRLCMMILLEVAGHRARFRTFERPPANVTRVPINFREASRGGRCNVSPPRSE